MADAIKVLVEMLGPIALVAMLASAYGTLRRSLRSEAVTQVSLGLLFGLVSLLMMHAPMQPFDGLIIDLRNVPIALAGAFLGFRGLATCLLIAWLARLGIGGVGTLSGIAAMTIAGFAGFLWAEWRRNRRTSSIWDFVTLSLAMSTHLVAVVLLPVEMAIWFLSQAALPLFLLNTISITLVALLLNREARVAETRMVLDAVADDTFLKEDAFRQHITHRQAADGRGAVAGLIAIRLHYIPWLVRVWGKKAVGTILGAMRVRLQAAAQHGDVIALSEDGFILVPLTQSELDLGPRTESRLVRALTSHAIDLGPDEWARISVSTEVTPFPTDTPLTSLNFKRPKARESLPQSLEPVVETPKPSVKPQPGLAGPLQNALFSKAEYLMRAMR